MAWKKLALLEEVAVLTDTAPVDVTKEAAAVGTAGEAARQDHKHDVACAVPGAITEDHTAAEGTSTSVARADHEHGSPAGWTPAAHITSHKSGGSDEIGLDELKDPVAAINIAQQQLDGMVLEVAATPPDVATEVEGQLYYSSADDHVYVWVAA